MRQKTNHLWFRHWFVAWSVPGHFLNQCWNENSIEILIFSFTKMCLKVSSAKWRPFCLGLNVLKMQLNYPGWHWFIRKGNNPCLNAMYASDELACIHTVYPKKYAHGFVVLCFVLVMQSFIMNSHEVFIHIHQDCFAGTGAIVILPQCQWSKPGG